MNKQEPKFQVGDVVKNARNGFQRIIRNVTYIEKDGEPEVRYLYSEEELVGSFKPTGRFKDEIAGECSQTQLLNWQRG
jgi:hypothetical protein